MKLTENLAKKTVYTQLGCAASWELTEQWHRVTYALLLVSNKALSTDDIMDELSISRGNANMDIRDLLEWVLEK